MTRALVYRGARRLGGMLAGMKLAERRAIVRPDGRWWLKRRRPWAGVVVAAGNACLALSGVPQRMLSRDAWAAREIETYALAYGVHAERVAPDSVLLPALPGTGAAVVLVSRETPADEKGRVLTAAARALAALHRMVVRGADGSMQTFSHGDATVANVLWDAGTGRASWLDLDVTHGGRRSDVERRVDDLRTLAYSAAAVLAPQEYPLVPAALATGYADVATLRALAVRVCAPSSVLLPVWAAHVPRSLRALRAFEAALRAGLEARL